MVNLQIIKAKIIQKLQEINKAWFNRSIQKKLYVENSNETLFWNMVSLNNLTHAYSDDEPDYDACEVISS